MKPHKHAKVIKAWADGAEIQARSELFEWTDIKNGTPNWFDNVEYRIKPEVKPHIVQLFNVSSERGIVYCGEKGNNFLPVNLQLTFDGETKKLISSKVIL